MDLFINTLLVESHSIIKVSGKSSDRIIFYKNKIKNQQIQ